MLGKSKKQRKAKAVPIGEAVLQKVDELLALATPEVRRYGGPLGALLGQMQAERGEIAASLGRASAAKKI